MTLTAPDRTATSRHFIVLERACAALASLVRSEFGEQYTLAQIAETWGEGITPEQVSALRSLDDGSLFEAFDELFDHGVKRFEIDASQVGD